MSGALVGMVALATGTAFAAPAAPPAAPGTRAWTQKMKKLESTLQDLLVDLASDARFDSKANRRRIERNAETLAKLAHDIKSGAVPSPDADPSVQILAGQFASEANHAYKTLAWGHREYARGALRSITGYCIACHTRSGGGPSFSGIAAGPAVQALRGLEKADYLTSVRQFDLALGEYDAVLAEPSNAEGKPFDWERAARSALAIAVRVKKDPDRALAVVERVLASPKAPYFLKEQASQWKKSLLAWKTEPTRTPRTEEGYYALAVQLVSDAKALQRYPADRSADILYLRASAAVHDLLSFAPNGAHSTEALYLAGLCYEVLRDLHLWDQHEPYYLACILKSPHSEQARRCYQHYEESIYLGFSGSGGTHLPSDVAEKLRQLDRLSSPARPEPLK